mmetsp:Transcript_17157/g.53609  ORF Transcript_17157/g.53609 Transcript_17157/m.53609 type:complete len:238 (+) Transcript_17157:616-1329(+)
MAKLRGRRGVRASVQLSALLSSVVALSVATMWKASRLGSALTSSVLATLATRPTESLLSAAQTTCTVSPSDESSRNVSSSSKSATEGSLETLERCAGRYGRPWPPGPLPLRPKARTETVGAKTDGSAPPTPGKVIPKAHAWYGWFMCVRRPRSNKVATLEPSVHNADHLACVSSSMPAGGPGIRGGRPEAVASTSSIDAVRAAYAARTSAARSRVSQSTTSLASPVSYKRSSRQSQA